MILIIHDQRLRWALINWLYLLLRERRMSVMSEQKIIKLSVRAVCVPMQHPHKTASGIVSESPLVLVDIGMKVQ